jgi:hypothetical protein
MPDLKLRAFIHTSTKYRIMETAQEILDRANELNIKDITKNPEMYLEYFKAKRLML